MRGGGRRGRARGLPPAAAPPEPEPRALVLSASFYPEIAEMLERDALASLAAGGARGELHRVPGCLELAPALAMAADDGGFSLFVALGAVVRGETSHYDVVCAETARGLCGLARERRLALGFGVITAENLGQARERADPEGTRRVGARATALRRRPMRRFPAWWPPSTASDAWRPRSG